MSIIKNISARENHFIEVDLLTTDRKLLYSTGKGGFKAIGYINGIELIGKYFFKQNLGGFYFTCPNDYKLLMEGWVSLHFSNLWSFQ